MILLSHAPTVTFSYVGSQNVAKPADRKRLMSEYGRKLRVVQLTYDADDLAAVTVECRGVEITVYVIRPGCDYTLGFQTVADPVLPTNDNILY